MFLVCQSNPANTLSGKVASDNDDDIVVYENCTDFYMVGHYYSNGTTNLDRGLIPYIIYNVI